MRIHVRVGDLGVRQWDYLSATVPDRYAIGPNVVRMCVEFESPTGEDVRHVEMTPRTFVHDVLYALQLVAGEDDVAAQLPLQPPPVG